MKKKHSLEDVPLNVIPYYDDFEELEESKTSVYFGDPLVMKHLMNTQEIERKFDFRSMKFDEQTSRLYLTKQFDNSEDETKFKSKLKDFILSFVKEEVKIPGAVFKEIREKIESKRDEFEADKVGFKFDGFQVTLVGKKEVVALKKGSIEAAIASTSVSIYFMVHDKNKLKFLNFVNYFTNVMKEFQFQVQICGMESPSGRLSISGTVAETKKVELRMSQDMTRMSEIAVKTSVHQIDFLQRTQCEIVNDELRKDNVMLLLINVEGVVDSQSLQAKIMSLKKCGENEVILKSNITK